MESGQGQAVPTGPGQLRWGRGKPTRKMGSVKRGSSGAESRADRVTTASSSGHSEAFRARRVPADCRRCFFSVQDVTSTVSVNLSLARNWVSLSMRRPTWSPEAEMESCDLLKHQQAWPTQYY